MKNQKIKLLFDIRDLTMVAFLSFSIFGLPAIMRREACGSFFGTVIIITMIMTLSINIFLNGRKMKITTRRNRLLNNEITKELYLHKRIS